MPIGQLSKEAAEARKKYFLQYRLHQCSRKQCNKFVLSRLLLNSDPFICSLWPKPNKKSKPFFSETIELLLPETYKQHPKEERNEGEDESCDDKTDYNSKLKKELL